jgi:hypothetical protein
VSDLDARRFTMRVLGVILSLLGVICMIGALAGASSGDPASLTCFVPGVLLSIGSYVVSRRAKQEQGDSGDSSPI